MMNFFSRPIKLQSKIFYSISVLLTVFIVAQFLVEYNQAQTKSLEYLDSTNKTIKKMLTENIRGYIYQNDIKSIKYLVDAVENKYIKNIFILNVDGKILYSKSPTNKTKYNLNDLQLVNDSHISYSAFKLLDINMGYMVMQANHEVHEKETKEQIVKLFVNLCLVYFLGLLLTWFISKRISQPLNAIIQNIQVAPSDKPIEFAEQYISEFQYLATTIKNDRNMLIDLNQTLEIKVKDEISKNLLIEKKLFESEKLASMGEMIGNIAHQWRQPLSIISTSATGMLIKKEFNLLTDEWFIEACELINRNAQYLSQTIDDFRDFIKGDRVKVNFNLKENIGKFIKIVEGTIKANSLKVILNLDENINLNSYPNELNQCLINLFNNSKDVLIEMEEIDKYIFIDSYLEGDNVVISIKDNGGGIPIEVLPKIFEPYFTTKHKSQGTGLGLHMTYNLIADGFRGTIEATNVSFEWENKYFTGACMTITFSVL